MESHQTIPWATPEDLPFILDIQRKHKREVGFLPTSVFESEIKLRHVIIGKQLLDEAGYILYRPTSRLAIRCAHIIQAAIRYDARRKLLGTVLVEAALRDCRKTANQIYLWCAEDLEANAFWQSMHFRALAVRAGGRTDKRIHYLWWRPTELSLPLDPPTLPQQTWSGGARALRQITPLGNLTAGELPTWHELSDRPHTPPPTKQPPTMPQDERSPLEPTLDTPQNVTAAPRMLLVAGRLRPAPRRYQSPK